MRFILYTIFVSMLIVVVESHAQCRYIGGQPRTMYQPGAQFAFCNAYGSGDTCCATQNDTQFSNLYTNWNLPAGACADLMKNILCTNCDSWTTHLFGGAEDGDRSQEPYYLSPFLCPDVCDSVWNACENVVFTGDINPFWNQWNTTVKTSESISDIYGTKDAFCGKFQHEEIEYCFANENPYQLPESDITIGIDTIEYACRKTVVPESIIPEGRHRYVDMQFPSDGSKRLFLVDQSGIIDLFTWNFISEEYEYDGIFHTQPDVSFDTWGEKGLLGMAFHPQFATNGRFYISSSCENCEYNCTLKGATFGTCGEITPHVCKGPWSDEPNIDHVQQIIEFTMPNPQHNKAPAERTRVIWEIDQPRAHHNSGGLYFKPGTSLLTFLTGDGGVERNQGTVSLDPTNRLGKMYLFDVDGEPNVDPGVGNFRAPDGWETYLSGTTSATTAAVAMGFRNPWRCSYDRERPEVFLCGDVGDAMIEEVDRVEPGNNYGWPKWEGDVDQMPGSDLTFEHTSPILSYRHGTFGPANSITVAGIYRGTMDNCLYGKFIFADLYHTALIATEAPEGSVRYTNLSRLFWDNADDQWDEPRRGTAAFYGTDEYNNIYYLGYGIEMITNRSHCPDLPQDCPTETPEPCLANSTCVSQGIVCGAFHNGCGYVYCPNTCIGETPVCDFEQNVCIADLNPPQSSSAMMGSSGDVKPSGSSSTSTPESSLTSTPEPTPTSFAIYTQTASLLAILLLKYLI